MNAVGKISRKGMIREDTWIKDFTKDMLVKVANSKDMQLRDLHAEMDRQITRTDQLRLAVDCCYDSLVMTNKPLRCLLLFRLMITTTVTGSMVESLSCTMLKSR
jgi:hypothetical protein